MSICFRSLVDTSNTSRGICNAQVRDARGAIRRAQDTNSLRLKSTRRRIEGHTPRGEAAKSEATAVPRGKTVSHIAVMNRGLVTLWQSVSPLIKESYMTTAASATQSQIVPRDWISSNEPNQCTNYALVRLGQQAKVFRLVTFRQHAPLRIP